MSGHDDSCADARTSQDRRFGTDPYIWTDAHRRLHDALVLDGNSDIIRDVIEIADVDPVGNDGALAEFHVEEAVDGVIPTEDALVPDAHSALMAAQSILVADVHPAAQDEAAVAPSRVDFDATPKEDEALRDDVRVA